jgi:hypothetical protein
MSGNFVAINSKYYKTSSASGELGHVNRVFKENKNCFPELTKNNFGDDNIEKKFLDVLKKCETQKGKKIQKNSNTYIDNIVAFSRPQIENLQKTNPDDWQEKMTECFRDLGEKIKDKYGFEPVGFNFHADEGHLDPETGILKHNYHAHLITFNYDFKTGKAPLRGMKKNDWSKIQDLAGEAFKNLGFVRGEPKITDKKDHLQKEQYVHEKQKEMEKAVEKANEMLKEKDKLILEQGEKIDSLRNRKTEIIKNGNDFIKQKNKIIKKKDVEISKKTIKIANLNENIQLLKDSLKDYYMSIKRDFNNFVTTTKAKKLIRMTNGKEYGKKIVKDLAETVKDIDQNILINEYYSKWSDENEGTSKNPSDKGKALKQAKNDPSDDVLKTKPPTKPRP